MSPSDRETLDAQLRAHLPSLRRLATRLTGSLEASEEVMQESLLRMVRGWDGFRRQSAFKTWAIQIVLNVFRDWLAKRRDVFPLEDVSDLRQADPLSCAMAEELRRFIAQRVSALPPRQREVLILLTYEGYSAEEVGRLLDMQLANVYATLYQARQRLRVELAPYLTNSAGDGHAIYSNPVGALRDRCNAERHT
ncbi:MAG: RNA polymerase sigma factor [Planctomycetota bacterium]